jgi:hypothetical protein
MMEQVLRRKVLSYVTTHGMRGWLDAVVERIALTEQQLEEHGLEQLGEPLARNDPSLEPSGYDLGEQWDLDALPPDALQVILSKAIEDRLDQKAWTKALRFEKREQKKLRAVKL